MKLLVQMEIPDEDLAADTGDKLLGRRGRIERRLCELLAQELYKSCKVEYTRGRNPFNNTSRVRASVIVGIEHEVTHKLEPYETNPYCT